MTWLKDNVTLVSGGGSGLGKALVARFVDEGAKVAVLDKSKEKLDALQEDYGQLLHLVHGDVRSLEDNRRAVAETVDRFGRLDTFIGNAALWDYSTKLVDLPDDSASDAFDEVFGVNVKGYMLGAKAAVHELAKTGGSVIFTVSNAGFYPDGGGPLYTASKHAVVGLIKQLAFEFAPKVRVNGVAPGYVASDMRGPAALGQDGLSFSSLDLTDMIKTMLPLQAVPEPADYGGHYVLLASKANSSTATGAIINCDGGIGIRGMMQAAGGTEL